MTGEYPRFSKGTGDAVGRLTAGSIMVTSELRFLGEDRSCKFSVLTNTLLMALPDMTSRFEYFVNENGTLQSVNESEQDMVRTFSMQGFRTKRTNFQGEVISMVGRICTFKKIISAVILKSPNMLLDVFTVHTNGKELKVWEKCYNNTATFTLRQISLSDGAWVELPVTCSLTSDELHCGRLTIKLLNDTLINPIAATAVVVNRNTSFETDINTILDSIKHIQPIPFQNSTFTFENFLNTLEYSGSTVAGAAVICIIIAIIIFFARRRLISAAEAVPNLNKEMAQTIVNINNSCEGGTSRASFKKVDSDIQVVATAPSHIPSPSPYNPGFLTEEKLIVLDPNTSSTAVPKNISSVISEPSSAGIISNISKGDYEKLMRNIEEKCGRRE